MKDIFKEYWIGKDIDITTLKNINESGEYIFHEKIKHNYDNLILLSIQFKQPHSELPLLNHELTYKAFKKLFHDCKSLVLTDREYDNSLPIFLYGINRGSSIYEWVAQASLIPAFLCVLIVYGSKVTKEVQEIILNHQQIDLNAQQYKINALTKENLKLEIEKRKKEMNKEDLNEMQTCVDIILNQNILNISIENLKK